MKTKEEIEAMANDFVSLAFNKQDLYDGFINGYNQCSLDMANVDNVKVTRFEVIDESGRVYTKRKCKVELSYQDDDTTLKVFIKQTRLI